MSNKTTEDLAADVIARAVASDATVATAESCTAGALALALSKPPGAGQVFQGGFITYSKAMKIRLLGVPAALLEEKTAVCAGVAEAMARGAVERTAADIGVAVTGVAGPEPDEDGNPVGLVYCAACARDGGSLTARYCLPGRHDDIVNAAVTRTLELVQRLRR